MGIGGSISLLQGSVTSKVRGLAPNATNRWTDAFILSMIYVADLILCEQAEVNWATKDIALTNDANYFSIPKDAVWIGAVLFSEDGTTFNDGVLWPTTMNELDQCDEKWKDTGGTKPTHYLLLSTPGTPGGAIVIYPHMNTVTSQAIRIVYLACRSSSEMSSIVYPEKIEDIYYVPMTLSLMYGGFDSKMAIHYYIRAMNGIKIAKSLYGNRKDDVFHQSRPASPMGGQLA